MKPENLSFAEALKYCARCLESCNEEVLIDLSLEELATLCVKLGFADTYANTMTYLQLDGVACDAEDLPYAKVYADPHATIEIGENYLEIDECSKLYAKKSVIVIETHHTHKIIEQHIAGAGSVFCMGCRRVHPRTAYWFTEFVVTSGITSASCKFSDEITFSVVPSKELH